MEMKIIGVVVGLLIAVSSGAAGGTIESPHGALLAGTPIETPHGALLVGTPIETPHGALLVGTPIETAHGALLAGTPIGSSPSVEYVGFTATTTQNLPSDAFDGDMTTYYASYERSYTWVGLDLGRACVITKVGWSPRNDGVGPDRMVLGVFEGANEPDFMDAVPIYMIDAKGTIGKMDYADVECSLGFRYVRYVGPSDARCNVAELEFYGYEGEGDETRMYTPTNLPCVVIHTKNNQEPWDKVTYVESMVTVIAPSPALPSGGAGVNSLGSETESAETNAQLERGEADEQSEKTVVLRDTAGLRLRGNASMQFPKKPYRIKFANKHKVLGSSANAKNWTLVNNYGDKTLMRNIVAFHISDVCELPYTPFCRPVDVFVNGEYKGNYQLSDRIEVKKGRVAIEEMTPEDLVGEALSGGYLWEIDGYATQEPSYYRSPHGVPVTLHSPKDDEIVPMQRSYFTNYYQTMENAVFKSGVNDTTWRNYIDYKTFARYTLANQVCGNPDVYWSCYMYKKRGDMRAYTGPVWDFDIAFDNDYRQYPEANHTEFILGGADNVGPFVRHILYADQRSRDEMQAYWHIARNKGVSAEELVAFVDSVAQELDASQRLNFMRWPILWQTVHMNPVALGTYTGEVQRLKEFIRMRVGWMDKKLGYEWHPLDEAVSDLQPVTGEEQSVGVTKVVRDGQLLILKEGRVYNVWGIQN
ncbi:MAG: CotH kinase family protein [Paludibacteraceae bacterium]|nr:CotH kinase family protein [Paludibacteraceae bacterium]